MKAKWNYNITHHENTQSSYILNIFFKFTISQSNKTKKHSTNEISKWKGKKYEVRENCANPSAHTAECCFAVQNHYFPPV